MSVEKIKSVSQLATSAGISILNMSYFHGVELAMNAGVDLSIGDFVFEFDNTYLDYDRTEIMKIYRHSLEGYDIVSAVPDHKERVSSRLFYKVFDHFANLSYQIRTESFRILSRRVINRISSMNKTALYANCGLKTDMMVYSAVSLNRDRVDKKEKGYRRELAVDSLILFTAVGYKLSIFMTIVMMVFTVFTLLYSVVIYAIAHPVAGWTTTILFLSAAFFGLFAVLTIVIKYLQLLVDLVFKRKKYNFESVEKLTK